MPEPVSSIRNLGPATDAAFARAGIHSAEDLRSLGADVAYAKLIAAGTRPHFIGYSALVLGLQGRPWNDARGDEKAAMRKRFDDLKSETPRATPDGADLPHDIERALDLMGVRSKDR